MQKQKRTIRMRILGCLFATAFLCIGCAGQKEASLDMLQEETDSAKEELPVIQGTQDEASRQQETGQEPAQEVRTIPPDADAEQIYVQVNGAVEKPGVYQMEAGGRIFQAIELAGGMTQEAAPQSLNQAAVAADGQVITVYTYQEWEEIQNSAGTLPEGALTQTAADMQGIQDDRVNINTADLDTLCGIPGIGQTRARDIISYREQNGAFERIEDIQKVSGIKEGLFNRIKDKIKV